MNHRVECLVLTSANEKLDSMTRYCIRTLTKRKWESSVSQVSRGEVFNKKFSDLVAPLWEDDYASRLATARKIHEMIKTRMKVSLREVLLCLLKLHVHSIAVEDYKGIPLGRALYLDQSVFEHSCEAEAKVCVHFEGRTFVMRALKNLTVTSISKIRMSFVPKSMPVRRRQEILARDFYIKCTCNICVAELENSPKESPTERDIRDLLSSNISNAKKFKLMLEMLPKCDNTVNPYYLSKIFGNLASCCNSLKRYEDSIEYAAKALVYEDDMRYVTGIFEELLFAMSELRWNDVRGQHFEFFLDTLRSHKRLLERRLGKHHRETEKMRRVYLLYLTRSFLRSRMVMIYEVMREKLNQISERIILVAKVAVRGEEALTYKKTDAVGDGPDRMVKNRGDEQ